MFKQLNEMMILPIMLTTLLISSLMVLMSNSWLIIWVLLEMNTLSFCSILNIKTLQKKKLSEPSMKYFIIQSTASAVMILYLSTPSEIYGAKLLFMAGTAAMLVKLAASPFHSWFLEILPKISMKTATILMTWQKMAPIYLLMFMLKPIIYGSIFLSSIIGSITQMNKNKLMEILALSSIFNISWTMLAMSTSTQSLFLFMVSYWTVLVSVMTILTKINMSEINQNTTKHMSPWMVAMMMASLGGLPPTLGFYAKVQATIQALKFSMKEMVTILMVISSVNFYIYLRLTTSSMVLSPTKEQKNKEKPWKKFMMLMMMNITPLSIMTL